MPCLLPIALSLIVSSQADERAEDAWQAGRRREAIELAEERLKTAPDDLEQRRALVGWELAVHRYAAALERMDDADPRRGFALYALGRYDEALEHLDPSKAEHCELRIESLEALGHAAQADAAAADAAELLGADDPRVLYWRARAAARRDDHGTAVPLFRRCLAADPVHQAARYALGRSLMRLGERDEARAVLARHRELVPLVDAYDFARQSLDLNPKHASNRAQLASLEAQLGLLDDAQRSFACAEDDATPDERVAVALRHARFFEERRGDPGAATAVLERALDAADDPRLRVRASDVLERAGAFDAALEHLESARRLRPNDHAIQERLERVRAARGDS